jgi:hypothetical protein
VCSFTYYSKDAISALSQAYQRGGYDRCEFVIRAPHDNYIALNFTRIFGFRAAPTPTPRKFKAPMVRPLAPSTTTTETEPDSQNPRDSLTDRHGDHHVCAPPEVIIRELLFSDSDSDEDAKQPLNDDDDHQQQQQRRSVICGRNENIQTPQVFQTKSNSLKITYVWVHNQPSGFSLDFDFHQKKSKYRFLTIYMYLCTVMGVGMCFFSVLFYSSEEK